MANGDLNGTAKFIWGIADDVLRDELGEAIFTDHNIFGDAVADALKKLGVKLSAAEQKIIFQAVSRRVEDAPPVIRKVHKPGKGEVDPRHGLFANLVGDPGLVLEYEPDSELRDSEQAPLLEEGGIEAFFRREVLPHVPDAGSMSPRRNSVTRYPSRDTSTSRRRCGRWKRSRPICSNCRRKVKACWKKSSGRGNDAI